MSTTRIGRLTAALLLIAVLALGVVALSACGSGDDEATASSSPSAAAAAGPITVTDDSGVEVTLDAPAEAIVSLAPANTEIAYAVGAGDKMVAGTSYDDYPEEAKALPKIGDFSNPNVEKIASYSPDLVLAAGGIQDKLRTKLEDLGMTVYVVDPKTYDDVIATIENIGKLAGTEDGAADRDRRHDRRPDGSPDGRRRPAQGDDVPRDLQRAAHDGRHRTRSSTT